MFFHRKKVSQPDVEKIQKLLDEVIRLTGEDADFMFSYFENYAHFISEIEQLKKQITTGDKLTLTTIAMHFAPTSSFQELSIQNGWDEKYLDLADKFDEINDKY